MRIKLIPLALGLGTNLLALSALPALAAPAAEPPLGLKLVSRLPEAQASRNPGLPAQQTARAALLEKARLWQSRGHPDLALDALDKLFAIVPDDPDGLAQLALIQLETHDVKKSRQTLARLKTLRPDHPGIARIEDLLRLDGPERDRMREARMLARGGRVEQALDIFRKLYPHGPPSGDLALEYWQLVAQTDGGWERAYVGLKELLERYPDNQHYQLALAAHVTARHPDDPTALKTIIELARLPRFQREARSAWRHAMLRLTPSPTHVALVRQYLAGETVEDKGVESYLAGLQVAIAQHRKLLADPYYRARLDGLALLDGGMLDAAAERLDRALAGRPTDPEVLGGLGLLRLRQGHHAEAQAYFQQALKYDPGSSRWSSLLQTARFWGLMREASDAAADREYDLALYKLHEARAIDLRQPSAIVAQAQIYQAQQRMPQAEAAYLEALSYEPANVRALQGLAELYLDSGREQAAQALLARVPPGQRKKVADALDAARASMYKKQADALLARGDSARATAMLEQALRYDRADPWLRFDLARLYLDHGDAARGNALFAELLARRPDDPAAHYAQALYLARQNRRVDALTTLESIARSQRTDGMTALQRRMWVDLVTDRARALVKTGQGEAARKLLRSAENALGSDRERVLDLADAWIDAGDEAHARDMLANLGDSDQDSVDWELRRARLLYSAHADELAQIQLTRLQHQSLDDDQRQALVRLQVDLALRAAAALNKRGRPAEALQLLAPWHQRFPQDRRLLADEARYLRADQRPNQAERAYRDLLALQPDDRDAASSLVELLIKQHRADEARRICEAQRANLTGASPDQLADLVSNLIDLQQYEAAAGVLDPALAATPDQPRLLALAGQLARRDGRLDQAIDYLQRALANEIARSDPASVPRISTLSTIAAPNTSDTPLLQIAPAPASTVPAEVANGGTYRFRRLADMLDQRGAWLSAAADIRVRSGTPGLSDYRAAEIPIEWKQPQTRDGRWIYRADVVSVDAGRLDTAADGNDFGSLLVCRSCTSGVLKQSANGLALDATLLRGDTRYDLGTSPLGFPVHYLVGGILHKGDLGPFGYSVDLSRRPLTGSLLSYAGARDPASGRVWGGVRASGVRFGLSLDDGGTFGGWSSLGLHLLSGENVVNNRRLQLMGGAVYRAINEDNRLLQFGVTGMLWHMSANDGEYTFGHGGYYSPGSYRSLSLPITYGQRWARLSVALRAAISTSHSEARDARYYPTDTAMQSAAEANAASNGVSPFYSGGPGHGVGRSLALAWEYQAQPKLFFGGRIELERSPDYAPNRLLLYLRYSVDRPAANPVSFLPAPLDPTSQY